MHLHHPSNTVHTTVVLEQIVQPKQLLVAAVVHRKIIVVAGNVFYRQAGALVRYQTTQQLAPILPVAFPPGFAEPLVAILLPHQVVGVYTARTRLREILLGLHV